MRYAISARYLAPNSFLALRVSLLQKLVLPVILYAATGALAQTPAPQIVQLSPPSASPGAAAFTLTVNGTGFVSTSVVLWNGNLRTTTFINGNRLTASILATDIAQAGTTSVIVSSPSPGGGSSNVVFFPISKSTTAVNMVRTDIASGANPQAIGVGDFDSNGKEDLAIANGNGNTVSIFLGNGNGTFSTAVNYATAAGSPAALAIADFNGDRKPDLVVVLERSNQVSILLGNGDGTFQVHQEFSTGATPQAVAVGDFNADGNLDLAISDMDNNSVSVLLGKGDGTFQPKSDYTIGVSPRGIAAADFNGDGKLDLAIANNSNNSVSVLLGLGDGTFSPGSTYATAPGPGRLVVADFNKDGKLDLAVTTSSSKASILVGKGDGTFQTHVDYSVGANSQAVVAGDFNCDGLVDVAITNYLSSSVSILLGNGNGTFKAQGVIPTNTGPVALALGDFNGDGKLDFAAADSSQNLISILSQSSVVVAPQYTVWNNQQAGFTSVSKTVTITNRGTSTLTISNISVSGPNAINFAQSNSCPSSLGPGATCTISVTFTPSWMGYFTANVVVTFSDGSSTGFELFGAGVISVILGPHNLQYNTQLLFTTSNPVLATFTNFSNVTITVNSVLINGINPGSFAFTNNNCPPAPFSLGGGQSCTFNVTFTPVQTGGQTGALNVFGTFSPGQGQQALLLAGIGTAVAVTPSSLSFPPQAVGTTSSPQTITVQNAGTGPLAVTISVQGTNNHDFAQTNNCNGSIPAKGSCTISVTFTPTATGTRSATINIGDADPTGPQIVSLMGTGQ